MASSTANLARKLDGAPPVLPPISPLIERRKLHPSYFEPVAESLEKGGFSVGWNDGSLQVGGSLAQSGLSSPTSRSSRSSYRPRTSGFLSFSKAPDVKPRGHRSTPPGSGSGSVSGSSGSSGGGPAPSAPLPDAPLTPPPGGSRSRSRTRTPHPRFSRLGASLDSATASHLLALAQSHINDAAADPDQRRQQQYQQQQQQQNPHQQSQQQQQQQQQSPPEGGPQDGAGGGGAAAAAARDRDRPPPPPASPSPSRSSGGASSHPHSHASQTAPLPSTAKIASTMGINVPAENMRDSQRPATGMPSSGSGPGGTMRAIIQVPLGVPSPRSHQAQVAAFRATRGHALMVFNELDSDKNGKVTRSEFEAAALSLGFSLEQAQRFWDRLDRRHRGFLEALDWGTKDAFQQIQLFSTRYMQKYMGVPDVSSTPEQVRKFNRAQELMQVKSLAAAVNMARTNAVAKGMRMAGYSGNPIFDTFRFMDVDGSGVLSKEEVRDAFFALGVYLAEPVAEQIMQMFDKNGNGTVQYHEFENTMFPPVRGN
ncbi:hypothetical protein PLESTB_000908200 [Pleodorina starrii]|uniref:EF-hand domain-containing protein n=1 Tax=Pleodorina starrii TaxID=330485 RepID=A0A9W6F317_9CHLO|nr:hypothetical protein PLESTM_001519700 [Pleodorina starrii]GLC54808.1 hypothetical protein PLESTB_000908200 [Pleodorina starrii]